MTYVLADENGYVVDFATGKGLAELSAWANAHSGALARFLDAGITEQPADLAVSLRGVVTQGDTASMVEALLVAAEEAQEVLILSDGLGDDHPTGSVIAVASSSLASSAASQVSPPSVPQAVSAPVAGMPTVMVPVDVATHERLATEAVALNESRLAAAAKKQRQLRSAALRNKHRVAFLPMFKKAAETVVHQEVKALRSILRRSRKRAVRAGEAAPADEGQLSLAAFDAEMAKFYEAFPDVIRRQFQPVVGAFAKVVQAVVFDDELGVDPPEAGADPDELAADFADDFADRHVGSAQGQLRAVIGDSEEAGEDPEGAIEERLGQWEDGGDGAAVAWADKISGLESVRALASISKSSYAAAGITTLVWMAGGTSCALCDVLVGETTEIGGNFRDDGEEVAPDDASGTAPLKVRGQGLPHSPLHSGCDCTISAAD